MWEHREDFTGNVVSRKRLVRSEGESQVILRDIGFQMEE